MHDAAKRRLQDTLIGPSATLAEAMERLDAAGTGALIVAGDDHRLLGLLSDGDVRRAVLRGQSLTTPCSEIMTRTPLVAEQDIPPDEALAILDRGADDYLDNLPLVTADGIAVGLLLRKDITRSRDGALSAVIMAGGFGRRMLPLTEHTPKPLLPVGGKPLIEHTLAQLAAAGIPRIAITTHHLAEQVERTVGDGSRFGIAVDYVHEAQPLGTGGALSLLPERDETLLVINGDVLTSVDFPSLIDFHRRRRAMITTGVRACTLQLPYGVVECDDTMVLGIREKPEQHVVINAGIYLLEPGVRALIPRGRPFDMPELIDLAIAQGHEVHAFPIAGYWLDIGRPSDYRTAQRDLRRRTSAEARR